MKNIKVDLEANARDLDIKYEFRIVEKKSNAEILIRLRKITLG